MSTKTQLRTSLSGWVSTTLIVVSLLLSGVAGCAQAGTQLVSPATPTPPPTPLPTATIEAIVPSGWDTYTSQRCEYVISYPSEMQITNQGIYSRTLGFKLDNTDEEA